MPTGRYRSSDRDRPPGRATWARATWGRAAQSVLVVSYDTFAMLSAVSMLTSPVPPAHGERLTLWLYGASAVTGIALAVVLCAANLWALRAARTGAALDTVLRLVTLGRLVAVLRLVIVAVAAGILAGFVISRESSAFPLNLVVLSVVFLEAASVGVLAVATRRAIRRAAGL